MHDLWSSYKEEGTFKGFVIDDTYTPDKFTAFTQSIVSALPSLKSAKYLLACSEIPYKNIVEGEQGDFSLSKKMFINNR